MDSYTPMHQQPDWLVSTSGFLGNLVSSVSMDMENDPRFFQDNVIDQRVSALQALGVVSSLIVKCGTSDGGSVEGLENMLEAGGMSGLVTFDGIVFQVAFGMLAFAMISNLLATYVSVAQSYHVFRLVSAGPMGFEMAKSYYMNRNITNIRHFTIRSMLWSIPLLLIQAGLRFLTKFDTEAADSSAKAGKPTTISGITLSGWVWLVIFVIAGLAILCVHNKHESVFMERYELIHEQQAPVAGYLRSIGSSTDQSRRAPDL